MSLPQTIGFPRMMKEPSEKRVFLPEFIQFLTRLGLTVWIEDGYGSRSGFTYNDYRQANERVHAGSRTEVFQQDVVLVLRSPLREDYSLLRPGACLLSMLHFPTRPRRIARLESLGVNAISLDSLVGDDNTRLVENMVAVAWNGVDTAFAELEKRWPGLRRSDGEPVRVLVLGTGMVGRYAVDAATKLGNVERNDDHIRAGSPGVIVLAAGRNLTGQVGTMERLLREADILVDATQRRDPSRPVVPNAWLAWLPEHAIIADLAVDPYTLETTPPVVRGVEGIPQGNLDKYVFHPADEDWEHTIPACISSQNRRTVVSCYSWPGIHPEACMRHYARQLEPLMEVLAAAGYEGLSPQGSYFERALYRASLHGWLAQRAARTPPARPSGVC